MLRLAARCDDRGAQHVIKRAGQLRAGGAGEGGPCHFSRLHRIDHAPVEPLASASFRFRRGQGCLGSRPSGRCRESNLHKAPCYVPTIEMTVRMIQCGGRTCCEWHHRYPDGDGRRPDAMTNAAACVVRLGSRAPRHRMYAHAAAYAIPARQAAAGPARPVADPRLGLLSDARTGLGCRSRGAVEMGCGQRDHGASASRSPVGCPRFEFALGRTISQLSATASYPADFRRQSRRFLPSISRLLDPQPGPRVPTANFSGLNGEARTMLQPAGNGSDRSQSSFA
jgi:hypothetical protein